MKVFETERFSTLTLLINGIFLTPRVVRAA